MQSNEKKHVKTTNVSKGNINSVMKFVALMSSFSSISKSLKFSVHITYTRDDKHDTLFLVMPITKIFIMHLFPGSHKISQEKFLDHEFDKTNIKFIQISHGEAVLFNSRTVFVHCEYNKKFMVLQCQKQMIQFMTLQFIATSIYLTIILPQKIFILILMF